MTNVSCEFRKVAPLRSKRISTNGLCSCKLIFCTGTRPVDVCHWMSHINTTDLFSLEFIRKCFDRSMKTGTSKTRHFGHHCYWSLDSLVVLKTRPPAIGNAIIFNLLQFTCGFWSWVTNQKKPYDHIGLKDKSTVHLFYIYFNISKFRPYVFVRLSSLGALWGK